MRKYKWPKSDIFEDIFTKIYSKLECNIIYVFLCGGDCKSKEHQIRNNVKNLLEKYSDNRIKVLYPEDLFFEKGSKNITEYFRNKDLLELETILAHNANIVCIICESIGSATELGAFTNYREFSNNALLDKLVAVTYKKYEKYKPSFISEGPIKRIVSRDKEKWILYNYDKDTKEEDFERHQQILSKDLINIFEKICKRNNKNSDNKIFLQPEKPIKNFIGLAYLILLYLYFYESSTSAEMKPFFKEKFTKLHIPNLQEFDFYYRIAINFLLDNQGLIYKQNNLRFMLTESGKDYIKILLKTLINIKSNELDDIRTRIMYNKLYKNEKKGDYIS